MADPEISDAAFRRLRSFPPGRPFTHEACSECCPKCNAVFKTEERLRNHEQFAHSKHPLTRRGLEITTTDQDAEDDYIPVKKKGQTYEEKIYRTSMKMSDDFFQKNLERD
jgi:hypothetical protein